MAAKANDVIQGTGELVERDDSQVPAIQSPMTLIERAIELDVDVEKLERLMICRSGTKAESRKSCSMKLSLGFRQSARWSSIPKVRTVSSTRRSTRSFARFGRI